MSKPAPKKKQSPLICMGKPLKRTLNCTQVSIHHVLAGVHFPSAHPINYHSVDSRHSTHLTGFGCALDVKVITKTITKRHRSPNDMLFADKRLLTDADGGPGKASNDPDVAFQESRRIVLWTWKLARARAATGKRTGRYRLLLLLNRL